MTQRCHKGRDRGRSRGSSRGRGRGRSWVGAKGGWLPSHAVSPPETGTKIQNWYHDTDLADGEQHIIERHESHHGILTPLGPLQPPPVVAHINVGQVVDELQQHWNHGVQPVTIHLLTHETCQTSRCRIYPPVQNITCFAHIHLHATTSLTTVICGVCSSNDARLIYQMLCVLSTTLGVSRGVDSLTLIHVVMVDRCTQHKHYVRQHVRHDKYTSLTA